MTKKLKVNRKPVDDALDAEGRKINWLAEQLLGNRNHKSDSVRDTTMYAIMHGDVKIKPKEAIHLAHLLDIDISVVVTDIFPYLSYLDDYVKKREEESAIIRKSKTIKEPSGDELIEQLQAFYINRTEALDNTDFNDLITYIEPTLLLTSGRYGVGEIIEHAIGKLLHSLDKGTINEFLDSYKEGDQFVDTDIWNTHIELSRLLNVEEVFQARCKYNSAHARGMNRHMGEFINDFCDEDGTVDWEKLVAFNSSKR